MSLLLLLDSGHETSDFTTFVFCLTLPFFSNPCNCVRRVSLYVNIKSTTDIRKGFFFFLLITPSLLLRMGIKESSGPICILSCGGGDPKGESSVKAGGKVKSNVCTNVRRAVRWVWVDHFITVDLSKPIVRKPLF